MVANYKIKHLYPLAGEFRRGGIISKLSRSKLKRKTENEKAEMILKAEFGSGLNVKKVFLDSSGYENPELRTVHPG